jgi:lipopolysaccharide export LptBFGC system permease protein LptF
LEIVDTDSGPAIVVVNNQRKAGTTNFLVLHKRDGKYRLSVQGRLDTKDFSHASWSAELVDADEDGYQELLFVGKDSSAAPRASSGSQTLPEQKPPPTDPPSAKKHAQSCQRKNKPQMNTDYTDKK